LIVTAVIFAITLAATFFAWFASERTLSIHSIFTTRRETFYWLAVLFTFALGTAAGDLLAESLNLGYALSLGVFAAAIVVVALLYRFANLNAVAAFWIAYVLTRPLGASTGDLLSQGTKDGGLGLGTTPRCPVAVRSAMPGIQIRPAAVFARATAWSIGGEASARTTTETTTRTSPLVKKMPALPWLPTSNARSPIWSTSTTAPASAVCGSFRKLSNACLP
jgi:hypothetical protein